MAAFEYTALSSRGKTVKGVMEGDTARQIRSKLREKSLSPLTVEPASTGEQSKEKDSGFNLKRVGAKLSPIELTLVTRQLATLVRSGLPIERALNSIAQQADKQKVKTLIVAIRAKVLEGHSLAQAFSEFPHVFPEIYRSTIAAGEASGHLDEVLMRLADYAEQRHEMSKKLLESLMYPIVVIVMSFLIMGVIFAFVVPKIVSIFESNAAELPILTLIIIAISEFVRDYWWTLIIGAGLFWFFCNWFVGDERRRYRFHQSLLKMPVFGNMIRARNAAGFARTLGILVGSSVPVLDAMRISSEVITNLPMRKAVEDAAVQVKEGVGISKSLEATKYFPGMMLHLIGSGESSGTLDEMLISAADYQDMEVSSKTSALMSVMQPMIILILGGFVVLIIMGIMMPIFDINDLIQN